jgi:hypothetical protein
MLLSISFSSAQVPGSAVSAAFQPERLSAMSRWFVALDGFLADNTQDTRPETAYRTWVKWAPAARLPSVVADQAVLEQPDLPETPVGPTTGPTRLFKDSAQQALDELAMISFGISSREDGFILVSKLPVFASAAAALFSTQVIDTLVGATELHDGANPLRVLLSFLSSLNVKDREAFRRLAGMELDVVFRLLGGSGTLVPHSSTDSAQFLLPLATSQASSGSGLVNLMDAERLLATWRSNRLRAARLQQGSLSHAVARAESGKHLAVLLDTAYGALVFNPGWAGEHFIQDAKQDLNEAWSAIGRAVASDLRREAAPWLARSLGTSNNPAFNLEYTVRPSPSNPFLALMTMRAIVNGVSYGIPHRIAARALASAASAYFDDAPVPLRYVEEPLPGLRIYVPRDATDSRSAITDLVADLAAAYPAALGIPYFLVHIPLDDNSSCEEVCIALDGAYREAALGVRLARSFTALLHGKGYPVLASLILHERSRTMEEVSELDGTDKGPSSEEEVVD